MKIWHEYISLFDMNKSSAPRDRSTTQLLPHNVLE